MKCPECHALAHVTAIEHGPDYVERRRKCLRCGLRFITREVYAGGMRLTIKHVGAPVSYPDLSPREAEVLALLAEGKSDREIGEALGISHHTVKQHCGHIYVRLGVKGRLEAALWAVRNGEETAQ